MKKKFVLVVLALFTIANVYAQKFEAGLNGGRVYAWTESPYVPGHYGQGRLSSVSMGLIRAYRKFSLGFSVTWQHSRNTYKEQYIFPANDSFVGGYCVVGPMLDYTKVTVNVIPVSLQADKLFVVGRCEMYVGVVAGGGIFFSKASHVYIPSEEEYNNTTRDNDFSYFMGLHAGGTWFVTKRVGVNVDVTGEKYDFIPPPGSVGRLNTYYSLVTAGIRYKLK